MNTVLLLVEALEPAAADQGFDAAPGTAPALGSVRIDGHVSPLAGDGLHAGDDVATADNAAAAAGSHDHAKDQVSAHCRAAYGFGQSETVGVVLNDDFSTQQSLEVLFERLIVQAERVRILHESGARRDGAGCANAKRVSLLLDLVKHQLIQLFDIVQDMFVAMFLFRRKALTEAFPVLVIENDAFDFGAA